MAGASRHHKGDTVESDRKVFCWEIGFVSATHLQSSKFVSKSLHVKWWKRLWCWNVDMCSQNHRKVM